MTNESCGLLRYIGLALLASLLHCSAERPEAFEGGSELDLDDDFDSSNASDDAFESSNVSASSFISREAENATAKLALKSHANLTMVSHTSTDLGAISLSMVNMTLLDQMELKAETASAASTALKIAAIGAALYAAYRCLSALWFSRKCDCRRWKAVGKFLLTSGYDEFEGFEMLVHIHLVQDIQNNGLLGKKEYKVLLGWNWSKAETGGTKDMRWEQVVPLEVPQGAAGGRITLMALGTLKDTPVGNVLLDTKKDMLDKGDVFFGKRQKFVMRNKGKTVGTLVITFRKKGEGALANCPIEGVDDNSALYLDLVTKLQELIKKKKIPYEHSVLNKLKPGEFVDGDDKVYLLAETLAGNLRRINLEDSSELGKCYIRVLRCNFSELKGKEKERRKEFQKQLEKAAKKGFKPGEVEKKWYVAIYPNKASAYDGEKYHEPDEFFPLATITSVHRSPGRQDQFLMNYTTKAKQTICFRRDAEKALDSWVDGFELAFTEVRETIAEKEEAEDLQAKELVIARQMHASWLQTNGFPNGDQAWSAWYQYLKSANLEDESIRTLYREITAPQPQAPPQAPPAKGQFFQGRNDAENTDDQDKDADDDSKEKEGGGLFGGLFG